MLVAPNALGIGAASFASDLGMGFGNGDEVAEPVEVPRFDFEKRDGNMASKDIAESPTAERSGAGTPKRKTTRPQEYKTTRPQDYKTTRPQDYKKI